MTKRKYTRKSKSANTELKLLAKTNFEDFCSKLGKNPTDVNSTTESDSITITWNEKTRTIFYDDGVWDVGFNDKRSEVEGMYPVGALYYAMYLKRTFPEQFNEQKV